MPPIMFTIGETIYPWPGENIKGVVRHIRHDPEGAAVYCCYMNSGHWFMIDAERCTPEMRRRVCLTLPDWTSKVRPSVPHSANVHPGASTWS